jgi:hypothetical protein
MGNRTGRCCRILKARNLGAEDKFLRVADFFDGFEDFLPNLSVLPGEIKHLNRLEVTGHICHGISLCIPRTEMLFQIGLRLSFL